MKKKSLGCLLAMLVLGISIMTQVKPIFAAELGGWDEIEGLLY